MYGVDRRLRVTVDASSHHCFMYSDQTSPDHGASRCILSRPPRPGATWLWLHCILRMTRSPSPVTESAESWRSLCASTEYSLPSTLNTIDKARHPIRHKTRINTCTFDFQYLDHGSRLRNTIYLGTSQILRIPMTYGDVVILPLKHSNM